MISQFSQFSFLLLQYILLFFLPRVRIKQQLWTTRDVIGEIVSYEDVQSIKQDDSIRMFMNIEIQDYESNNISATLWGDFVEQIKPHLNGSNDKPVVVVMQLVRAHRYREQYSMRNTWHASKLWINSNLPQVVDFCSRMVFVRGESSQRITQISSHKTHSVADELASGSIEVKTIEDLSDCKHPGDFWVVATIVHVELDRGWYMLQVKVIDCTGIISLLLWDKDATKIIGKSANDLKDAVFENYGIADDSSCPMEIENIVDKKFMFKVEVKSSNDNELIDVANTPAKMGITNLAAVVEEDSNAQLSENKIKRVFKKKTA
ncbi:PREDICTED: uncharacterized protein LOC109229943 [Nicotiana attenuata]|uniref:uncharacterized protein LOC109229943 n=1 Tax=Nicotiana attenuata TaxID=49451 RepID=UPI000904F9A8|nr:PREDICTED: uncharacterized protein LOC109229943 [Nicotiana attenuata]